MSRKATYPAEWQNQFGVPVSEHQNKLQVSVFNGHAVFSIEEDNNHKEGSNGNDQQSEHMHRSEEETNTNTQGNVTSDAGPGVHTAFGEPAQAGNDNSGMRLQG